MIVFQGISAHENTFTNKIGNEAVSGCVIEVVGHIPLAQVPIVYHANMIRDSESFILIVCH